MYMIKKTWVKQIIKGDIFIGANSRGFLANDN